LQAISGVHPTIQTRISIEERAAQEAKQNSFANIIVIVMVMAVKISVVMVVAVESLCSGEGDRGCGCRDDGRDLKFYLIANFNVGAPRNGGCDDDGGCGGGHCAYHENNHHITVLGQEISQSPHSDHCGYHFIIMQP
jgi:hypothetical protein